MVKDTVIAICQNAMALIESHVKIKCAMVCMISFLIHIIADLVLNTKVQQWHYIFLALFLDLETFIVAVIVLD